MDNLIEQLRRLQYAANMLAYDEFCKALGWEANEYALAKFHDFQRLGAMHTFDSHVLRAAIEFYEAKQVR
jgi:hypothetical protein